MDAAATARALTAHQIFDNGVRPMLLRHRVDSMRQLGIVGSVRSHV
jgi:hypothetical protein